MKIPIEAVAYAVSGVCFVISDIIAHPLVYSRPRRLPELEPARVLLGIAFWPLVGVGYIFKSWHKRGINKFLKDGGVISSSGHLIKNRNSARSDQVYFGEDL